MAQAAPFTAPAAEIEPSWIDYNGHLNMAYYNVLFDRCADHVFAEIGLTENYVKDRGLSFYVAEVHVCYLRELHLGASVTATFQLLDCDEKRLHAYSELIHEDGWVAATSEALYLHIDASGPKVAPIPEPMASKVAAMRRAHADIPYPERAGRRIKINKK
ncbi:thioesterase family protein [Hoeflea poritis]|uniref:Thioesterase family protein n=1 Tax=Hoeflea poritis TaxID=2993659 RepID=A0ABT4VP09_9HYPH|nr:thioesterase family protein [Hoeflea poritis]MDA4846453.1 thioesterase family protein [Hoeflea poritis]